MGGRVVYGLLVFVAGCGTERPRVIYIIRIVNDVGYARPGVSPLQEVLR